MSGRELRVTFAKYRRPLDEERERLLFVFSKILQKCPNIFNQNYFLSYPDPDGMSSFGLWALFLNAYCDPDWS